MHNDASANSASEKRLPLLYHELRAEKSTYSYVMECRCFQEQLDLFCRTHNEPGVIRPEITFDDGHFSNLEYAVPMLTERALVARFFITVGWTGTRRGYMGWQELRTLLSAGQRIGAHGWSHTLLTHLHGEKLARELRQSRETLEDKLATPIHSMSLPGGRFNREVLDACEAAGYSEVWTSVPRAEPFPFGPLLGRLNVRGDFSLAWMQRLLQSESGVLRSLERQHRMKTAIKMAIGDNLYAKLWGVLNHSEPGTDLE